MCRAHNWLGTVAATQNPHVYLAWRHNWPEQNQSGCQASSQVSRSDGPVTRRLGRNPVSLFALSVFHTNPLALWRLGHQRFILPGRGSQTN
ncbi:unnamed protein product [Protopolystoma xenopodis]|uniref:Uncharacterized protein n=1 Tax=Protopolystoma xenopodis TaxID=117903 RepID=A0A3S5B3C2_9PLAT|nr:unnamed protein product [Protopolystoma xenopodis]